MNHFFEELEKRHDQVTDRNVTGYLVIFSIFVTGLVTNFVIAGKIVDFLGFTIPASAFVWALTYPCSDIVAEVYGVRYARKMVLGGFVAFCMAFLVFQITLLLPAADFWDKQGQYDTVLATSFRVMLASITSYAITQTFDVYAFGFIRRITKSKYLWLRNNLSTLMSQTLANIIFISIAFLGTFSMEAWWALFFGNLSLRYILAFSDTLLVYIGVYGLYKVYPSLNTQNEKEET
jgi:hypothetical protein